LDFSRFVAGQLHAPFSFFDYFVTSGSLLIESLVSSELEWVWINTYTAEDAAIKPAFTARGNDNRRKKGGD